MAPLVTIAVTLSMAAAVPAVGDQSADPPPTTADRQGSPVDPTGAASPEGKTAEPDSTEPSDTEPSDTEPSDTEPSDTEPSDAAPEPATPTDPAPSVNTPAAERASTTLALTAAPGLSGRSTTVELTLTDASGAAVADAAVTVERRAGDTWAVVASPVTGADGTASTAAVMARSDAGNEFRASFAGSGSLAPSTSPGVVAELRPWAPRISLTMPRAVIDERTTRLDVLWRTVVGDPVDGMVVKFERRSGKRWVAVRTMRTDAEGRAGLVATIRSDSDWRVTGLGGQWVRSVRSTTHHLDNRPPRAPVVLPSNAPRPRVKLPAQKRSTTVGPDIQITTIPDTVWREMNGVTWKSGCPVGRSSLRLVRMNYWAYDGYRRQGEIVVHKSIATKTGKAFTSLYLRRLPIRSMYRVDRFGYNWALRGGDDHRSMAADNTSGFNCRRVVNSPGRISPHSYGRAVDINPWENPYRSSAGYTPNTWWPSRSHPEVAWRNSSHVVVGIMKFYGFRWTYGAGDLHHFDG